MLILAILLNFALKLRNNWIWSKSHVNLLMYDGDKSLSDRSPKRSFPSNIYSLHSPKKYIYIVSVIFSLNLEHNALQTVEFVRRA